jgi:hypothetical protein
MKRKRYRGKGWRARQAEVNEKARRKALKKALGIRYDEILGHIVGRRRWLGMRDYAPEENGPVRVRKPPGATESP